MRTKYLWLLFLIVGLLTSCKSKKSSASTPKVKNQNVEVVTSIETPITTKKSETPITDATLAYIEKYKNTAMEEMQIYKIPASITLAQGILESSSGRSELTNKSNNHFGIKCHKGWEGDKTYHDDDHKGECFRVYEDPRKSFRDHSLFLAYRTRYSKLFKYKQGDYVSWAKGLSEAGYATDRRYPAKLIALIEKYELHKYDAQVLGKAFEVDKILEEEVLVEATKPQNTSTSEIHVVEPQQTLYSIAKSYGLAVDELKAINNLNTNNIFVGQELLLKENRVVKNDSSTQNNTKTHFVAKGDTLYSISRKYNIPVEEIKKINNLASNNISVGQTIILTK